MAASLPASDQATDTRQGLLHSCLHLTGQQTQGMAASLAASDSRQQTQDTACRAPPTSDWAASLKLASGVPGCPLSTLGNVEDCPSHLEPLLPGSDLQAVQEPHGMGAVLVGVQLGPLPICHCWERDCLDWSLEKSSQWNRHHVNP